MLDASLPANTAGFHIVVCL